MKNYNYLIKSVILGHAVGDALGVPVTELFVPTPTDTLRCPHCGGAIKIEKGE